MDQYAQYEAIYAVLDAALPIVVAPVTSFEDQTGEPIDLPYAVYRTESERGLYGTPDSGSSKILRSTWVISVYAHDLDDALAWANDAVVALVDGDISVSDGYETTAITLIGFMPLFEKEGPNYAVHARVMWERSV